ncbi:FAS-associated factor 2 [Chytridiales sp. JEL 0842]|nr:FAS-associated factor 2 [Chytridiales sp. JEL 0842]
MAEQRLTDEQREKVEMLQAVTGIKDIDRVISVLSSNRWNLERSRGRRSTAARRRPPASSNDPQAAAARFLLDFEQAYGATHPIFFQGTYTQALEVAKREIRYLLVILNSSDHDDTPEFNRNTLTSTHLISFLQEKNFLIWAGDIRDLEAFLVSDTLEVTQYPFVCLISPENSKMVKVRNIEGLRSAEELVDILRRNTNRLDGNLASIRAEKQRQEQARIIREQQEQAYAASLRADQEKENRAREEKERLEREKQEELRKKQAREEKIEARKNRKVELRNSMVAEPALEEEGITKLSIRLPSGERILRRFKETDKLELLYNFVESHDLSPLDLEADFVIVNTYPRKVLVDQSLTLKEAGLCPSASIVVEEKDDEE